MPIEFLADIEKRRFPLVVRTMAEVDKVRVLKAAEMLTAAIPPCAYEDDGTPHQSAAIVFGLTEGGARAVRERRSTASTSTGGP